MCLDILDLISARVKYNQWITLIKSFTIRTSRLSTNRKNFQQDLGLHLQYTSPSTLLLIMSPSKKTWSISRKNITPSNYATNYSSSYSDKILYLLKKSNEYNRNGFETFQDKMELLRGEMNMISASTEIITQDNKDLHDTTTKF